MHEGVRTLVYTLVNCTTCYVVLGFFKLKAVEVIGLETGSLDEFAYSYLLLTKVCFELNSIEPAFYWKLFCF